MNKVDYKKELKPLYSASARQPTRIDVPTLNYLRIDGSGDPNTSSAYRQAVESVFSLAYTIKFAVKKARLRKSCTSDPSPKKGRR